MTRIGLAISTAALSLALAGPALAQTPREDATRGGLVGGAVTGAAIGATGGPVGAGVGAIIGGATGATAGAALTPDDRVYVRNYVVRQRAPAVRMEREVVVGTTLPRRGVTYRTIEGNPRLAGYRYTTVNDRTVLVDRGGRVVQIIE